MPEIAYNLKRKNHMGFFGTYHEKRKHRSFQKGEKKEPFLIILRNGSN